MLILLLILILILAEEMGEHTKFKRVYREVDPQIYENPDKVKKIVFCTGKIYYELADEREKLNRKDIAIVRIEQLAPFPWDKVAEECAHYKDAQIVWCQEEPKNMGAWSFVQPRIETATRGTTTTIIIIINTNTNNSSCQWCREKTCICWT